MATQYVNFISKVFIPVHPCQEVVLCLPDLWAARTDSGFPWIYGTIGNSGRFLGSSGRPFPPAFENVRDLDLYEYQISFDDTQFNGDFTLTCADITEVSPYACIIRKIEAALP